MGPLKSPAPFSHLTNGQGGKLTLNLNLFSTLFSTEIHRIENPSKSHFCDSMHEQILILDVSVALCVKEAVWVLTEKATVPGDPANDSDRLTMCNRERGTVVVGEEYKRQEQKKEMSKSRKTSMHTNQKQDRRGSRSASPPGETKRKPRCHPCCSLVSPLGVSRIPQPIGLKHGAVVYE